MRMKYAVVRSGQRRIDFDLFFCYNTNQAGRFLHGELSPLTTKEGGERMSDYEMIMVILTVLSLVVVLITKDRK